MAKCRYKVGLLNLRDCGSEAETQCATCNRPVCGEHLRHAQDGTVQCLECFSEGLPEGSAADRGVDRLRYRRSIYGHSHYHPYYMGRGPRYGHDDYDTFDDTECGTSTDCGDEERVEASDFQDS